MEKKGQTLYLECASGISGDMTVAALLDLGADEQALMRMLESLPVDGFQTVVSRVKKSGIDACDFDVVLDHTHENHDHDMEYLHGHDHSHEHSHDHDHSPAHDHVHAHEHRSLADILHIISHAQMSDRAKEIANRIFQILAEAEAKAHALPLEQVHFHEVGAVDSIVDVLAAAFCLDDLNITEVIIPELCEGRGTVRCQHGVLPVPVPAVVNIVQAHGLHLHITDIEGELVTPTGAAIAAAIGTSERLPERFSVRKIGMGAGKRNYERPSILRAMLIDAENASDTERDQIWKLETNIDDCTGENLGFVMDRLMEAGARDVHYLPVYMKKNRPAYQLNVICSEGDVPRMEEIIFAETTTIGIRRLCMERSVLKREIRTVETELGEARVKVCCFRGEEQYFPEYESVAALCRESGRNYPEVYERVRRACEKKADGLQKM